MSVPSSWRATFQVKALGGADYLDCDEDMLQLQLRGSGPVGSAKDLHYALQGQTQVVPKGRSPMHRRARRARARPWDPRQLMPQSQLDR